MKLASPLGQLVRIGIAQEASKQLHALNMLHRHRNGDTVKPSLLLAHIERAATIGRNFSDEALDRRELCQETPGADTPPVSRGVRKACSGASARTL